LLLVWKISKFKSELDFNVNKHGILKVRFCKWLIYLLLEMIQAFRECIPGWQRSRRF